MKLGIEEVRFRLRGGNYFKKIAELGFSAADYSLYDITEDVYTLSEAERKEKLQKIAKMANEAGIEIFQAHGPSHRQTDDRTVEGREKHLELAKTAIRACHDIGCKNLVLHTFMAAGEKDAETPEAETVFAINKELFTALSDYALNFDVTLCIENMRQDGLSLGNPEEVIRLIDEIGRDNVKMCFDVGHAAIFSSKISVGDAIRKAGDRIACTHFHDNYCWVDIHLMPMLGLVNWDEVCAAFKDIGFDGVLSIDSSPRADLPEDFFIRYGRLYTKTANILKNKILYR